MTKTIKERIFDYVMNNDYRDFTIDEMAKDLDVDYMYTTKKLSELKKEGYLKVKRYPGSVNYYYKIVRDSDNDKK